jgi:putative endonuclease
MPAVYVLRDAHSRYYIGCTENLETRLAQHRAGGTQTIRRMSPPLELVGFRHYDTMSEALRAEREFKRWKNAAKVAAWLNSQ